jgi:hypothetical protein
MTSANPRPRSVQVAFWSWVAAAVVLVLFGMWLLASTAPIFTRGVGVILAVAGLAVGYLAARTANGDKRFRRAAVALSLALAVLLALLAILNLRPLWLIPMVLLLAGAHAATRTSVDPWFDAVDSGREGG